MPDPTPASAAGSQEQTLLNLFKTQLERECSKIGERLSIEDRGKQLLWWYFLEILGLSEDEAAECACDGSGDLGIDAIWIDDDKVVHIYQFKHPERQERPFGGRDIDCVISGLRLILSQEHERVANEALKDRINDIYDIVPTGYRLHLVTSGSGIAARTEPHVKLDAFIAELQPQASNLFRWDCEPLKALQDRYYEKTLPAIERPIEFQTPVMPYMVKSGSSECYMLHAKGSDLATLFSAHGEALLQRNIRVAQGATSPNRSILATCKGTDSVNFLHYNNGVTFLCDTASFDPFRKTLTLIRAQVVNGGQTVRALSQALSESLLRDDVLVPLRVITSNGNKEFGSNVAVNQNNQNLMKTGFLRANDPRIVQLAHALLSLGWFLERREGEVRSMSEAERSAIEARIVARLIDRVIPLREGTQAYTATFREQPELAKKDPKKMFDAETEGGQFERIFSDGTKAEDFIVAWQTRCSIFSYVSRFTKAKLRKQRDRDWKDDYESLLPGLPESDYVHADQLVPTSQLFLCATIYSDHVRIQKLDAATLPGRLAERIEPIVADVISLLIRYAQSQPEYAAKAWPTRLKNQSFYRGFMSFLAGRHDRARNGH